jgi:glycosyltransferase involved in cell wall biosynthesis
MSNNKPMVSVVIIFLDEEQFIREAIESVLAQGYEHWELLLVDDGSRDGSANIARGYQAAVAGRVRVLTHKDRQNRGMSASRNLGLMHATGDYVSFLDADDVWLPEKLEQQVAFLGSHPDCAMVCGTAEFWYSWSGRPEDRDRDAIYPKYDGMPLHSPVSPPTLLAAFLVDEGACPSTPLIRRDAAEQVHGYENAFCGMYEDQAFYAKLCLESSIIMSDACWYRYRRHKGSCVSMAHRNGEKQSSRYRFLSWLNQYLSERGREHDEISAIVQSEISLLQGSTP